jgi:hypothetical protein
MDIISCLYATEKQIYNYFLAFKSTSKLYVLGKYLYLDNNAPLCLVAHVDTLQRKNNFKIIQNRQILSIQGGGILGADDRAGIFALASLYSDKVNILITSGEEVGGVGARQAANDLQMSTVRLMIEFDRRGCNEYVYYSDYLPKQVATYVEAFGFEKNYGSYSDIAEFPHISAVNLSIGYYNQHTGAESLHLDEMYLTIQRAREMINNPIKKKYKPEINYGYDYFRGAKKTKATDRGLVTKIRYSRGVEENYGADYEGGPEEWISTYSDYSF